MSKDVKALNESTGLFYDTVDCMNLIKKKYPYIPKRFIQKVLYAEECYMHNQGIIDWVPKLSDWFWK